MLYKDLLYIDKMLFEVEDFVANKGIAITLSECNTKTMSFLKNHLFTSPHTTHCQAIKESHILPYCSEHLKIDKPRILCSNDSRSS